MPPATRLGTNIELRISCKNLPSLDLLSKSDTFALVYVKHPLRLSDPTSLAAQNTHNSSSKYGNGGGSDWEEIGKTEVLYNNNDPSFSTGIRVPYIFEEVQPLKIVLWDYDEHKSHDYVGEYETTVGRLMGSRGSTLVGKLVHATNKTERGSITVSGTEISTNNNVLRITFFGHKLDKKDFFGASDPYLTISRPTSTEYTNWLSQRSSTVVSVSTSTTTTIVSTSSSSIPPVDPKIFGTTRQRLWSGPVVKNSLDPRWPTLDIPLSVCSYDPVNIPVMIECWDYNKREAHELIGELGPIALQEFINESSKPSSSALLGKHQYSLINPEKQKKKGKDYNHSGYLTIENSLIFHPPTLLEYIVGGCQMNLIVAVDFTGSNGDPQHTSSLHYIDPRPNAPLNQYASAIFNVGTVLQEYDNDKQFPAFGFGGTVDNGRSTSHCFPLNLAFHPGMSTEVYGVNGLLQAYSVAIRRVGLSGPTLFTPVIRQAMQIASEGGKPSQQHQKYTTLLLLTDGQMNDPEETVNAIVEAANSGIALSIIIVGVGNANFDAMEVLDGDGDRGLVNDQGQRAVRDIVQFVPFNKFMERRDGGASLAAEVLAELPQQVCQYFVSRNIVPNPPLAPILTAETAPLSNTSNGPGIMPPTAPVMYPPPQGLSPSNGPMMMMPPGNTGNTLYPPPSMYPPVVPSPMASSQQPSGSFMYPPSTNPSGNY